MSALVRSIILAIEYLRPETLNGLIHVRNPFVPYAPVLLSARGGARFHFVARSQKSKSSVFVGSSKDH